MCLHGGIDQPNFSKLYCSLSLAKDAFFVSNFITGSVETEEACLKQYDRYFRCGFVASFICAGSTIFHG